MKVRLILLAALVSMLSSWPTHAQERSRWLGASGRNSQVELMVFDVSTSPLPKHPGREAVTIATAWRNIVPPEGMGEIEWKTSGVGGLASFGRPRPPKGREALSHTAYLVPSVADHVYLISGNGAVARTEDETEIRLARQGDEAEWIARFELERTQTDSMLLMFYDFDGGHISIPLTDQVPPHEGSSPLSEANNEHIRARIYAREVRDDGMEIEIGLLGTSEGNVVDVDLGDAFRLVLSDGTDVLPLAEAASEWFDGPARILPLWEQRARLLFVGTGLDKALSLDISLPGQTALHLALGRGQVPAVKATPPPATLHSWDDGPEVRLAVLRISVDAKNTELLVRIGVTNGCGSDLVFSPAEQFLLVSGRRAVPPEPAGTDGEWVVPDGTRAELELHYVMKRLSPTAELHYKGFEQDNRIQLEVPDK
jgi:hypothetical protein